MKTIGIDFGTGNSILAAWTGATSAVFTQIGEAGSVRSDVAVDAADEIIVDPETAHQNAQRLRVESTIKRRLMAALDAGDLESVAHLKKLAVARLRYLYDAYCASTKERVVKAVLTCPANTGQAYRNCLLEIGREIGLPSIDIVDEPTAAAVHHGLRENAERDERWMVIDWGCGTCDISLIQRKKGSPDLEVVCVKGDNQLGGADMDRLLLDHLAASYNFSPEAVAPYAVEAIKKQLSTSTPVRETLSLKDGNTVAVEVERKTLEALVAPLVERVRALVEESLKAVSWGGVDHILATGGPILMPCVRELIGELEDETGADVHDSDPLTSVALGAARLAELKRRGGLVVTNKVAKSIGIRVVDREGREGYHPVIQRGENRPVTRPVTLATSVDLQDVIEIEIREGENTASVESNPLLARLNAVVRPENKGAIRLKLQIALDEAGGMEAYIEPLGDKHTVREVKPVGIRLRKEDKRTATAELRAGDPVSEFKEEIIEREADPDTARQVYERLKIKYHPDRDAAQREHWNQRLAALDDSFNGYLAEVEKRMRASSVPNLPWGNKDELRKVVVDEVLAHRLTHCIANGIGTEEQRELMPKFIKLFADYRRVLASYLFGIKRNPILQKLLAEDDRPHVGLVVLLQNLPGKPIRERHEVLKAAYRVKEEKVRELLRDPNLDVEKLYAEVPKVAEALVNPMGGGQRGGGGGAASGGERKPYDGPLNLQFAYDGEDTLISGKGTYPNKEKIKALAKERGKGARWDKDSSSWRAMGVHLKEEDFKD